ncbi:hypothetical protein C9374_004781 [Naegleria lovaniensis]|uniref:R3H domain-containing protein n=1 Tax=Naegleria lovaniensis TaxID=51637 RepID=A0AA88GKW0_NAELO|nr:uncharacterized protein C9374_004781 [Naegleria lovaniensis]KAG2382814.1 hypothetical protein C9374_004781 [Naegleria lovaniensis]
MTSENDSNTSSPSSASSAPSATTFELHHANEISSPPPKRSLKKQFFDNQTKQFFNDQSRAFTTRIRPASIVESSKKKEKKKQDDYVLEARRVKEQPLKETTKNIIQAPAMNERPMLLEFASEEELQSMKENAEEKFQIDLDKLFELDYEMLMKRFSTNSSDETNGTIADTTPLTTTNTDSNSHGTKKDTSFATILENNHVQDVVEFIDALVLPIYSTALIEFGKKNLSIILQWEYILDKLLLSSEDEAVFDFPPAKTSLRTLEHNITDYYKIESRGMDAEPNRRVHITRKKSESRRPIILLSDVLNNSERYQQLQQLLKNRAEKLEALAEQKNKEKLEKLYACSVEESVDNHGFQLVTPKKKYAKKKQQTKSSDLLQKSSESKKNATGKQKEVSATSMQGNTFSLLKNTK